MKNEATKTRTPSKPRLIINGDDFGYSEAVNRAIIQAHREGVLTSASLMVNEQAADHAVALARENPGLAVGLHLSLVLGRAALPYTQIPHITNADGKFTNSPFLAGIKYYFHPAARRELRREMRAQFERFIATGLPFSHVDGHNHLHMHPVIFRELIRLCREYGVRNMRVVKGQTRLSLKLDRRNPAGKLALGTIFNLLGSWCEAKLREHGFARPPSVYGFLQTGDVNENYILGLLEKIGPRDSEIYAHPLAVDAAGEELRENPGGAIELQALLSERLHQAIERAGFDLANYPQL